MKLKKKFKFVLIIILILISIALVVWTYQKNSKKKEGDRTALLYPFPLPLPQPLPEEIVVVEDESQSALVVKPSPVESPETMPPANSESGVVTISNPDSVTVLVNKKRYLDRNYVPPTAVFPSGYAVSDGYEARPVVVDAYIQMVDAMEAETGLWMYVTSSYRGYASQERLYNNYVAQHGEEEAKRFVAYPGSSEHQTGLVVDVVTPGGDMFAFGNTEQSDWVNANAHRFGFVIRYEKQFEDITGYMAEAWHLRYLGVDVADAVYRSGRPFDEYYTKHLQ